MKGHAPLLATALAVLLLAAAPCSHAQGPVLAPAPLPSPNWPDQVEEDTVALRFITIGYQNSLANGALRDVGPKIDIGTVRVQAVRLGIDIALGRDWNLHAGIPYVKARYLGPSPHCPTSAPPQCAHLPALTRPHPESAFLDDGRWHGSWQDFDFVLSRHGAIGDYLVTPSLQLTLPSHDYPWFAQAAVGRNLTMLAVGATLGQQVGGSNWFWSIGYARVFAEKTLGYSVDHNRYQGELGYLATPDLTLSVFGQAKLGGGIDFSNARNLFAGMTNELYYHHDQINAYQHFDVGFSADYQLGDRHVLSVSAQRLVWGETTPDLHYALDVSLTRTF
jgi:hypothetical protein